MSGFSKTFSAFTLYPKTFSVSSVFSANLGVKLREGMKKVVCGGLQGRRAEGAAYENEQRRADSQTTGPRDRPTRTGDDQAIVKVPHPKCVCLPMWSMDANSR